MKTVATLLLWSALPAYSQTFLSVARTLPNDGPSETRAIDLNGDGRPDLLTIGSDNLSVRLNDGTGNFPAVASIYPLNLSGGFPPVRSYATGDFNGDSRIDLVAVTNFGIFLYAGNGKGGFGTVQPTSIQTQIQTQSAVAADFNRDGFLDIAVSVQGTGVRLFLGNGAGDFREQVAIPGGLPGSTAIMLQPVDVDGNGSPDLMGVDLLNEALYVLLNDGTGTFRVAQLFKPDFYTRPVSFYAADYDRDGKLDLAIVITRAIVNSAGISFQTALEYWTQTTPGVFSRARTIATLADQVSVRAADINGDGNLDLVLAGSANTSLYVGDGKGSFSNNSSVPVTGAVVTADLEGKGRGDVILTNTKAISILNLGLPPSRVTLYRDLNPFTFRQTEIFTATVDKDPALPGFPTGSIRLLDNGQVVQTAMLFNGIANFSVPFSPGQHQFRVEYDGDSQYGTGTAELAVTEAGVPASVMGYAPPISAQVLDASGNPVSGIGVFFTAPLSGPSGTFSGAVTARAITDANGLAQAPGFTRNSVEGYYTIAVTVSGYPGLSSSITMRNLNLN